MGIEPTFEAWEAPVLPLNYTRSVFRLKLILCVFCLAHNSQKHFEVLRVAWEWLIKKWPTIVSHLIFETDYFTPKP